TSGAFSLLETHAPVGASALGDLARALEPDDPLLEERREHLQALLLRAELEQSLLKLGIDLDARRHLVGAQRGERARFRPLVGDPLEQVRVALARFFTDEPLDVLGSVLQELDLAGRVHEVLLALQQLERVSPAHEDVHAAVLGALEYLGDLRRAADFLQAVVGEPDDPELAVLLEAPGDHRFVAVLEDVERNDLARKQHDRQRKERKGAYHGTSLRAT